MFPLPCFPGGAPAQDRDGLRHGRDPEGGDQRIQGDADVPLVQSQEEGRGAH